MASQVDSLFFFLLGVTAFFGLLIAGLIVVFMIRFRRRPGVADELVNFVIGQRIDIDFRRVRRLRRRRGLFTSRSRRRAAAEVTGNQRGDLADRARPHQTRGRQSNPDGCFERIFNFDAHQ